MPVDLLSIYFAYTLYNSFLGYQHHDTYASFIRRSSHPQPVLKIKCTPLSVLTTSLTLPTSNPNVASSKGRCIWLRPNQPRSPPFEKEEQSECSWAREAKTF